MSRERPDDRRVSEFIAGVSFAGDILSEAKDLAEAYGAEEGTRTPTPLRVHGPEPCASANSATSASGCEPDIQPAIRKHNYCKGGVSNWQLAVSLQHSARRGWRAALKTVSQLVSPSGLRAATQS